MSTIRPEDFVKAAGLLASWRRPLLISHTNPDGDALGSLIAMRSLLSRQGMEPLAVLFDAWPDRYAFLRRYGSMSTLGDSLTGSDLDDRDGVLILDTCAYSQLRPIADWLRKATIPKLAVDHHITRDELGAYYLIDESAAANCLVLYEWARVVDWEIDRRTAEALFVGIAMDTGWFRHSNTDRRALAVAAELTARGARPSQLHESLFHHETPGRVRLLGAAIDSMELLANGRLAVMTLTPEVFAKTGAKPLDTEDIVNEPLRIDPVAVSILLVDRGDGVIRSSFRSKPPHSEGDPDIDAAAIAQTFGGGGHRRAAGARISGTLPEVRRQIEQCVEQAIRSGVPSS